MDEKELDYIESRWRSWSAMSKDVAAAKLIAEVRRLRAENSELIKRLAWVSAHPNKPYEG